MTLMWRISHLNITRIKQHKYSRTEPALKDVFLIWKSERCNRGQRIATDLPAQLCLLENLFFERLFVDD